MLHPPHFTNTRFPFQVYKLSKALYGIQQASQAQFSKLCTPLDEWGFTCSKADDFLFTLYSTNHIVYQLIYTDDIIIKSNNSLVVSTYIKLLHTQYALRDLRKLNYFLNNIEVTYNSGHIHKDLSLHIVMLESMPTPTS